MTTYKELSPEEVIAWRKLVFDFAARSTESVNRPVDLTDPEAMSDKMDAAGELLLEGLDILFSLAAAYEPAVEV